MNHAAKSGVLLLGVISVAALAFAACGGGGQPTTPSVSSAAALPSAAPVDTSAVSSAAPAVSSAPAPIAPPLVVSAMKLTGEKKLKGVEVKDDGSVLVDGKAKLKFVGAELQDLEGKTLVAVAADNSLKVTADGAKAAKFNAKDELEVEDGGKLFVGDDGVVVILGPDGKTERGSGKMKFAGFKPASRRAATLIIVAMLSVSKRSHGGPTEVPPATKTP